jgi:2-dehydro-3-deoxy-L-rhamnonate dehydrogenase (NAD+)
MIGAVPMRRMGSLDEVAATVVWLLSDESSYLTGQNLVISGGI